MPSESHSEHGVTSTPAAAASSAGSDRAYRSSLAWLVLGAVTAVGLWSDLWSKAFAFERVAGVPVPVVREEVLSTTHLGALIPSHPPVVVVPSLLEFTLVLNPGAVFGMGAGQRWFFVSFTAAALLFGLWLFGWTTRRREFIAHAAVGLLLSGGIGNLYDRLLYGCVRDFIHPLPGVNLPFGLRLPWGTEAWPWVSNVADLWLIIGIGVLLLRAMRHPQATADSVLR
jgi:signal peptidase II